MSVLLHIKASPRDRSYSTKAANAFTSAYLESHPGHSIDVLDLFTEDLPAIDGLTLDAKYSILHGGEPDGPQIAAWSTVERVIERFNAADGYLFSLPMWNFGIPYRLKHFIDVITQPGYTFTMTPEGEYKGLASGKTVAIYARGGEYPEGTLAEAVDFQKRYMDNLLGFIGLTEVQSILIQPTLAGGPEKAKEVLASAIADAEEAAKSF